MSKQKVVDEHHPRYGEIGEYDKQWVVPGSKPELHCHTVKFDDGTTGQFLSYQIEPVEKYKLPGHDEIMEKLDKLTPPQERNKVG